MDENNNKLIRSGDLRNAVRAECKACKHTWLAPTIGKCPKCRADNATEIGTQVCNYTRV